MNEKYDIIGDLHGYATPLKALLTKLGYTETNGVYRHQEGRKVIFLGDYIDRGPEIRDTLRTVRAMVDAGTALAIMGNHEFNALAYHTPDGAGGHLRHHSLKNVSQHRATMEQLALPTPLEWEEWLRWFETLPLFLDLGPLRAVHAAWDPEAVSYFKGIDRIHGETLRLMAQEGSHLRRLRENLINGLEVALPNGYVNPDKEGVKRDSIRTRWWEPLAGKTYRQAVFPDSDTVPDMPIPTALMKTDLTYRADQPPVFFGHYWLPAEAAKAPLAPNVACLDFSVAKGGDLTAYRWDGEATLLPEKFVTVENNSWPLADASHLPPSGSEV
jgi:hypothetical protein